MCSKRKTPIGTAKYVAPFAKPMIRNRSDPKLKPGRKLFSTIIKLDRDDTLFLYFSAVFLYCNILTRATNTTAIPAVA